MPWNWLNTGVEISPEVLEDPRAADEGCLIRAQPCNDFVRCFRVMVLVLKAVSILMVEMHIWCSPPEKNHWKSHPGQAGLWRAPTLSSRSLEQSCVCGLQSGKVTHHGSASKKSKSCFFPLPDFPGGARHCSFSAAGWGVAVQSTSRSPSPVSGQYSVPLIPAFIS